jgi:hypothetical protein
MRHTIAARALLRGIRRSARIIPAAAALALGACSGDDASGPGAADVLGTVRVAAVSSGGVAVRVGESRRYTGQAFTTNGNPLPEVRIAWASSNAAVATVSPASTASGEAATVLATGTGVATITASATAGGVTRSASFAFSVQDRAPTAVARHSP